MDYAPEITKVKPNIDFVAMRAEYDRARELLREACELNQTAYALIAQRISEDQRLLERLDTFFNKMKELQNG